MRPSVVPSGSRRASRWSTSQEWCWWCMMIRRWIMAIVPPPEAWGPLAMAPIGASSCIQCWQWCPEAAVSVCSDCCIKKPGCANPLLARPMAAKRAADSDESGHGKARCGREPWSRWAHLLKERCGSMWPTATPICLPFCSAVGRWAPSSWCEPPRIRRVLGEEEQAEPELDHLLDRAKSWPAQAQGSIEVRSRA